VNDNTDIDKKSKIEFNKNSLELKRNIEINKGKELVSNYALISKEVFKNNISNVRNENLDVLNIYYISFIKLFCL